MKDTILINKLGDPDGDSLEELYSTRSSVNTELEIMQRVSAIFSDYEKLNDDTATAIDKLTNKMYRADVLLLGYHANIYKIKRIELDKLKFLFRRGSVELYIPSVIFSEDPATVKFIRRHRHAIRRQLKKCDSPLVSVFELWCKREPISPHVLPVYENYYTLRVGLNPRIPAAIRAGLGRQLVAGFYEEANPKEVTPKC